jgi:stage II sporulation SpoAA-like protein
LGDGLAADRRRRTASAENRYREGDSVSIEIADASGGLLTVTITGWLKRSELERAQASALEVIRTHGKVRFLVIATNFLGWRKGDDWNDVSFATDNAEHIEKIAIVGDKRWEDLVLAFTGKGLRPAAIEYFVTADLPRARAWVASTP